MSDTTNAARPETREEWARLLARGTYDHYSPTTQGYWLRQADLVLAALAPPESRSAELTDLQEIARCLYLTDRQIYDRTYGGMEGETWETAPATSRANFEKYAAAILARGFHRSALAHPEAPLAEEERPGPLTETEGPHSCTEPNCKRCEKRPGEFCGDDDCNCGAPGNHAAQTPSEDEGR